MKLLIATHNRGKLREYAALLADLPVTLVSPQEIGLGKREGIETGSTYEENARRKALAYAQASGLPTLADDSGLEVDALDGAPGPYSARYAPGEDRARITALLQALEGVPEPERTARFRCVIALATPDGTVQTAEGTCEGRILTAPRGEGGFGYDPIFYLPDQGCTMAELPMEEKNRISHRARALQAARPFLEALLVARP